MVSDSPVVVNSEVPSRLAAGASDVDNNKAWNPHQIRYFTVVSASDTLGRTCGLLVGLAICNI